VAGLDRPRHGCQRTHAAWDLSTHQVLGHLGFSVGDEVRDIETVVLVDRFDGQVALGALSPIRWTR
jgi:hypothetical protein